MRESHEAKTISKANANSKGTTAGIRSNVSFEI
jgi:hypothetical protein